jgi:signal recognition particle subunit SRP72
MDRSIGESRQPMRVRFAPKIRLSSTLSSVITFVLTFSLLFPAVLRLVPGDQDAIKSKVFLLIESGDFDGAIKLIANQGNPPDLAFQRAYSLYRHGSPQDAIAALSSVPQEREADRLQLEAQLRYRMGDTKQAIDLYRQLFAQHHHLQSQQEIATNVAAAYVAANASTELPSVLKIMKFSTKSSYELAFNAACGLVAQGQYAQAEIELLGARRAGEEVLYDNDLEEDEVALELSPVDAQLAYVVAAKNGSGNGGYDEEAVQMLQNLLALDLDDDATKAIATINLYAALLSTSNTNNNNTARKVAGEALKKLYQFMERSSGMLIIAKKLDARLGPQQRQALLTSFTACALLAHKLDVAKEAIQSMTQSMPTVPTLPPLQAALYAAEDKYKEADTVLAQAISKSSSSNSNNSSSGQLMLMRAQLAASTGDAATALSLLDQHPSKSKSAVLATRISLMNKLGQDTAAVDALQQALQSLDSSSSYDSSVGKMWILKQLAEKHLNKGEHSSALAVYDQLSQMVKNQHNGAAMIDDPEVFSGFAKAAVLSGIVFGSGSGKDEGGEVVGRVMSGLLGEGGTGGGSSGLSGKEVEALENAVASIGGGKSGGGKSGGTVEVPVPESQRQNKTPKQLQEEHQALIDSAAAGGEKILKRKKRKHDGKLKYFQKKGIDPASPPQPPPDPERWLPKWERAEAKKMRKKRKDKEALKGSQGAGKVDTMLDRSGGGGDTVMSDATGKAKAANTTTGGGGGGKKGKKKGRR